MSRDKMFEAKVNRRKVKINCREVKINCRGVKSCVPLHFNPVLAIATLFWANTFYAEYTC